MVYLQPINFGLSIPRCWPKPSGLSSPDIAASQTRGAPTCRLHVSRVGSSHVRHAVDAASYYKYVRRRTRSNTPSAGVKPHLVIVKPHLGTRPNAVKPEPGARADSVQPKLHKLMHYISNLCITYLNLIPTRGNSPGSGRPHPGNSR